MHGCLGGVHGCQGDGVCMVARGMGCAWLPGACMVAGGCMVARGACMVAGGHA